MAATAGPGTTTWRGRLGPPTATAIARAEAGVQRLAGAADRIWAERNQPGGRQPLRWAGAALVAVFAISALMPPAEPAAISAVAGAASGPLASAADETAAPTTAAPPPPEEAPAVFPGAPLTVKPLIPVGKGMWLHRFERANGGDPHAIVAQARRHGITHLYLRVGSSRMGFYAQGDLDRLLPAAHAAGLKVVGWDFPYLHDPLADAERAAAAIAYSTPAGHRIDAFTADIETPSEGTNLTREGVTAYGARLRELAGADYPLIAAVPRPNPKRWFPYAEATAAFDAVAPMVYWINRDPVTDLLGAVRDLRPLGKPLLPVGQAYDPAIDGSPRWGPPSRHDLDRFMRTAAGQGVAGVSFWVWDTALPEHWAAISGARWLDLRPREGATQGDQTVAIQTVLKGFGHPIAVDGDFGPKTTAALTEFQRRIGVPATGQLDDRTVAALTGA